MKKWVLIALLSCSFGYAGTPEKTGTLSSKVVLQNTSGYFVLSDRSCWKTFGFTKRWRSLSEWWQDAKLVPEKWESLPTDWHSGTQIEVYPKFGNLEVDEANASNQADLKQCTHLLVNTRTGKILFAIALEPSECVTMLHKESREEGYNEGYEKGRSNAYKNATDLFNKGREEGRKAGYAEGYKAGVQNEQQPGS